jgi:hypothetical protein
MKKINIVISLFALLNSNADSRAQSSFQRIIGGSDAERAQTIFNTFDGGYLINGASFSFGAGSVDVVLVKLDNQGQTLWSKTYGTIDYDNAEYAIESSDKGIVCAGRSNQQAGLPSSAVIFKTDSVGNLLWSKSYGGTNNDGLVYIIQAQNNGYAAVGNTQSTSSGSSDILFIRTDANGDTIFTRSYGTVEAEYGTSVVQLPNNDYLISGHQTTFVGGPPQADALLIRTDSSGNMLWSKQYGDSLWEDFTAIKILANGDFIVAGSTVTFGAGSYDILLMQTDSSGTPVWSRAFGGSETDAAYDLHILPNSDFIVSGYTESYGFGNYQGSDSTDIFLMKADAAGNLLWMNAYGDGLQDEAFRSNLASDGGILIAGFTKNYQLSDSLQMMIIKTDSMGISGCHELPVIPVDSSITMPYQPVVLNTLSGMTYSALSLISSTVTVPNDDACLYTKVSSEESVFETIKIYPNPFDNYLHITIHDFNKSAVISIFDVFGRVIFNKEVNSFPARIETGLFERGIYLVSLKINYETTWGEVFIKN